MVDTAVEVVALGDTLEYSMRVEKVKAPADTARLWEGPKRRTTSCTGQSCCRRNSIRTDNTYGCECCGEGDSACCGHSHILRMHNPDFLNQIARFVSHVIADAYQHGDPTWCICCQRLPWCRIQRYYALNICDWSRRRSLTNLKICSRCRQRRCS